MEDSIGHGNDLYSQHGVLVKPILNWDDQSSGTLNIVEYQRLGKCIEWKPTDVSVVLDTSAAIVGVANSHEWALVDTIGETSNYNLSSSPISGSPSRLVDRRRPIRIQLSELKSYTISPNGQQMTFMQRDGTRHNACFQQCNANCFVTALHGYVQTTRSKKDKCMFMVVDHVETSQVLDQSFAELDLFTENKSDVVWKFVDNLQHRPYETTLQAFSKLTDFFLYRSLEQPRFDSELPAELRTQNHKQEETRSLDDSRSTLDTYEVIGCVRALPPRVLITRGEPLDIHRWAPFLDDDGRVTEVEEVKSIIFNGGIMNDIRYEVWKYLLGFYPWESTHLERQAIRNQKNAEYYQMKLQWRTLTPGQEQRFSDFRDRKGLIEKDVNRTDRTLPFYAGENNKNLEMLYDILMTYSMYNFDLGYVQGMNDLLSPILYVMTNEVDSFWCFVGFMELVGGNFALDQAGMKQQLQQLHSLVSVIEPELAAYLDQHDSGNMYFCFRWLLVIFKREFSYMDIMRLWEVLWTGLPCPNFHLLMCVAVLDAEKNFLMGNKYGFTEILKHVNDLSMNIELKSMLENAEGIHKQLSGVPQLANPIRQVIGMDLLEENAKEQESGRSTPVNDVPEEPESLESVTLSSHLGEAAFERALSSSFI